VIRALAAAVLLLLAACGAARACNLPQPPTDVVLTIEGAIKECNAGLAVQLDRTMLDAMPRKTIKTSNPWDQKVTAYEGVLLRDLMNYVKAGGQTATFSALNDYRSDIALADMERYDVILAFRRNGEDIPVRDKGPLFVVFPFSDVPELANEARYAQSVWQVNRVTVK
jgi:hypothetical protein